jgi:hypothetical protein
MSEWRQRGYVPDSDEDDIVLDDTQDDLTNTGNHAGDRDTLTTRSPLRDNQRYASEELFDEPRDVQRDGPTQKKPKYWEPITSSPQPSQDTAFDLPQDNSETRLPRLEGQSHRRSSTRMQERIAESSDPGL